MLDAVPPLGFAVNGLVRHTAEQDADALARHRDDPAARTVVFVDGVPLLSPDGPLHALDGLDGAEIGAQVFLGTLDGVPVLATAIGLDRSPPGEAVDLRAIAADGRVAERELGLLAEASSLLAWHAANGFCGRCGAATSPTRAGFRRDCPGCGAQHFPRTDPVVIMLVTHGDACLLGRQARYATGSWSCLAGFVEPGETIEDAVRRETLEEAGVRVGPVRYVASQPWPFPSTLMIGCRAEALDDALVIDTTELEDARWFARDEVRSMLYGSHPDGLIVPPPLAIAHHLIRGWASSR
jgi:NAD+ diphosphatase